MAKIASNHVAVEKQRSKPRILVAPLDWGLGHATRCIPVVYELLAQDAEVWLAGEGMQQALLAREFPHLPFLSLQGYHVKYSRSSSGLLLKILLQFPRLSASIKKENKWLKKIVAEHGFDAIISDNRFGLYHPDIPSIFITHQLTIKSPLGKTIERYLQKFNYRFINRFTGCWVPDNDTSHSLAGELSHPAYKPSIPVKYTGPLTRLQKTDDLVQQNHLFISLSGPEPQRTLLENKVIEQISHYPGTATIVRGLPGSQKLVPSTNDIQFYNHLPSDQYSAEMQRAEYVIARSGYSTVMDLVSLQKKSILIPTPGQPEQEYLAHYLGQAGIACSCTQKDFVLEKMLKKAAAFSYHLPPSYNRNGLKEAVFSLLSSVYSSQSTVYNS